MNIAIIANDKKKELITEFCMAYCGILSRYNLCATATTAKYIGDATGLKIEKLLAGFHGGSEQVAAKIAYGEVDLLILLCDTGDMQEYAGTLLPLVRACDMHSVPVATNIATSEALILALDRGDLDWRENAKEMTI
ncbi:MAG: methylglyoxal synthase [Clostridia bacterium]|nr:methylglyoxal synthase [Clostridia bacterium]